MNSKLILASAFFLTFACQSAPSRPLLQGSDFVGWQKPVGITAAHWTQRDGKLEGQALAAPLWTEREFGDFEITLEVRTLEGLPTAVLLARGPKGFQVAFEPRPTGEWSHIRAKFTGAMNDVDIEGQTSAGVLPGVALHGAIGLAAEGWGRVEIANVRVRELH